MTTICKHGCERASACSGACQPAPRKPGKHCRYCADGYELHGSDHWIVTSLARPSISIIRCVALPKEAA